MIHSCKTCISMSMNTLPWKGQAYRWYIKSPTVQDVFWTMPGFISCTWVIQELGLHVSDSYMWILNMYCINSVVKTLAGRVKPRALGWMWAFHFSLIHLVPYCFSRGKMFPLVQNHIMCILWIWSTSHYWFWLHGCYAAGCENFTPQVERKNFSV